MVATVVIPSVLSCLIQSERELIISANSLTELFEHLIQTYPKLTAYLFEEDQKLSAFIHVYLNEQDIRNMPMDKKLQANDVITIFPAIAGG